MDKGKYIEQLAPGSSFSQSIFIAVAPEIKQGKAGNPYAMFNIEDRTGTAPAKMWNVTTEQERTLFSGTYFVMSGDVDSGQYAGQVKINTLKPVDESAIRLDDFLAPLPNDHKFHYDRFIGLIKSVKHPHLKGLLRRIFADPLVLQQFKNAVAAKSMHHSHRGGLLEHSAEVAAMCDKMCDVLPGINRDLVVTCALLHDIGKLHEMEHGIHHGEYTADGNLLGHIVLGSQIIIGAIGEDFPPKLRLGVLHLIISHHKTFEFGSPKEPMTAEAQILAACDELSARVFQHRLAPIGARVGATAVKTVNGYAYLGGYGDDQTIESTFYPIDDVETGEIEFGTVKLPVFGTEDYREIVLPSAGADFVIEVRGNEIIEYGFADGDLVAAIEDGKPKDGSFVVASRIGHSNVVRKAKVSQNGEVTIVGIGSLGEQSGGQGIWSIAGLVTGLVREL